MNKLQMLGFFFIGVIVLNLVLFVFRIINAVVFWLVIVISAVVAYWVVPRIKSLS